MFRPDCHIQVYWPEDDTSYAGTVVNNDDNSKVSMHYHGHDVENGLDMKNEVCKFGTAAENSVLVRTKLES